MLKANTANLKHRVNAARLAELQAEAIEEFAPTTYSGRFACKQLARIRERLESMAVGSIDWSRLIAAAQTLSDALQARLTQAQADGEQIESTISDASTEDLAARAEHLAREARRLAEGEAAPESPSGAHHVMYTDTADTADTADTMILDADLPRHHTVSGTTRAPSCGYGCSTLARCAALKTRNIEAWRTIHWNDPAEIERRNREATRTMLVQLGRQR